MTFLCYICTAFTATGCSSARLEYTSGGRVVEGSNPFGYHCLLHYRCHTGGDTDKSVLYLPLRSHCDLRDDLAGYFG